PPVGGHHAQLEDVGMGRGPDQQVRVHVHVAGLDVEHVLPAADLPATAEAGAVVQDFLVRAQFDLGGDAQPGLHRVDLVGTVLVFLHHLGTGHEGQSGQQQRHAGTHPQKLVAIHHGSSPSTCSVSVCGTLVSASFIPSSAAAESAGVGAGGIASASGSNGNSRSGTGAAAKSSSTR